MFCKTGCARCIKSSFLLFFFFSFISVARAQDDVKNSIEVGGMVGITQYYGDVSSRIFSWKQKGPLTGLHVRYNYNSKWAGRFGIHYGNVQARDAYSKKASQRLRNVNFKSSIVEFTFTGEYNILGFSSGSKRKYPGMEVIKFSPYVFTGFDIFLYSPKASLGGQYYKVAKLDTELGKAYRRVNLSIPIGVGVKYSPVNLWCIGLELGLRKTFTDYLDDVSGLYSDYNTVRDEQGETAAMLSDPSRLLGSNYQKSGYRGNPKSRDWYLFMGITITKKVVFKNY